MKGVGMGGVGTPGKIRLSPSTQRMSARHHRENYQFNMKHAKEHLKEADHSAKKMRATGEQPTVTKSMTAMMKKMMQKGNKNAPRSRRKVSVQKGNKGPIGLQG